MSDLHALAERLEKATGVESAREIFREGLLPALGINQHWRDYYTESDNRDASLCDHICDLWDAGGKLDAAVALCERALPGWEWLAGSNNRVSMTRRDGNSPIILADAPTPALALCLAVVRAQIAAPDQERIGDE